MFLPPFTPVLPGLIMGEYGRKRMEDELEWKHQAPKLLRAYEEVLKGAKGQRGKGAEGKKESTSQAQVARETENPAAGETASREESKAQVP